MGRRSSTLVCFIAYFVVCGSAEDNEKQCKFEIKPEIGTSSKVQFDLTPLQVSEPFTVSDAEQDSADKFPYQYLYGFCGNYEPPSWCKLDESNMASRPAAALQVAMVKDDDGNLVYDCYEAGGPFNTSTVKYDFYNKNDPAKGITITYPNGGLGTSEGACGTFSTQEAEDHNKRHPDDQVKAGDFRYREFVVDVICDDDVLNIPDDDEQIVEELVCSYRTSLKSIYGCPTGCKVSNQHLCGQNGECGFDKTSGKARCFCYKGFYGADCTLTEVWKPGNTAAVVTMAVFCILLLVALIVMSIFVWRKVQGLRLDPEAYSSMGAENIASMQIAKTEDLDELDDDDDIDDEEDV